MVERNYANDSSFFEDKEERVDVSSQEVYDIIKKIAAASAPNRQQAHDVAQSVWIKLKQRQDRGQFLFENGMRTYIDRMVASALADARYFHNRQSVVLDSYQRSGLVSAEQPSVEDQIIDLHNEQTDERLKEAMEKLPAQHKVVLQLQLQGVGQVEIAAKLKLTQGAVSKRLSKARAELEKLLKEIN